MAIFGRIADALAGTAGAALLAQFPAFYQQYVQRLGGRLDQALLAVERLQEAASEQGLKLSAYVRYFLDAEDPIFRREGQNLVTTLSEAQDLKQAHAALSEAGPLSRPMVFLDHLDPDLVRATFERYVPALPIDSEGLVYAALGLLLGLVLLAGCQGCGRLALRPLRHRRSGKGEMREDA